MAVNYVKSLQWPVLTWIVLDVYFWAVSYRPGVLELLTPELLATVVAAVGFWAGWALIEAGGKWLDPILGGIVVGIVCGGGGYVLFGLVRGFGADALPGSTLDFSFSLGGAIIGGWWNLSRKGASVMGG